MRQIDADNLWEVLRGEEGAKALNHSPVKLMDIKQIIDNAPTIDAIPVEWLEQKRKCSDPESVRDINGAFVTICIDGVLVLWQKEQEG